MITTECYGHREEWNSREEAIAFFKEGIANSEGSERDRYVTIVMKLEQGADFADDSCMQ